MREARDLDRAQVHRRAPYSDRRGTVVGVGHAMAGGDILDPHQPGAARAVDVTGPLAGEGDADGGSRRRTRSACRLPTE